MSIVAPWQPAGSWSVLVDPPIEEPLTLAEAKLRSGLEWPDGDPRDALMRDFIAAARAQVERDTGLALLTQTRDIYFYTLATGEIALPAQALPLQSIEAVDPVIVPAGGAVTRVRSLSAWTRSTALEGLSEGVARCVVGWVDANDLRAKEPLLLQAVGLLTAHLATAGRDAVIIGTIASENPIGYEEAIASYRLVWVI